MGDLCVHCGGITEKRYRSSIYRENVNEAIKFYSNSTINGGVLCMICYRLFAKLKRTVDNLNNRRREDQEIIEEIAPDLPSENEKGERINVSKD